MKDDYEDDESVKNTITFRMMMVLLHIRIMGSNSAEQHYPNARKYMQMLERRGLLVLPDDHPEKEWTLTEKGHVFVQMLHNTPMPVQSWSDPRKFSS